MIVSLAHFRLVDRCFAEEQDVEGQEGLQRSCAEFKAS